MSKTAKDIDPECPVEWIDIIAAERLSIGRSITVLAALEALAGGVRVRTLVYEVAPLETKQHKLASSVRVAAWMRSEEGGEPYFRHLGSGIGRACVRPL